MYSDDGDDFRLMTLVMIVMMIPMMILKLIVMMMMMIRTEGRYSSEGPRRSRKERFEELTPFPFLDLDF